MELDSTRSFLDLELISKTDIRFIKNTLKQVYGIDSYFKVSGDWGSESDSYRIRLRQNLNQVLISEGLERDQDPSLNLDWIPEIQTGSASISHCPVAGGYWLIQGTGTVGFDLELTDRIQSSIVQRVSQASELSLSPKRELLWPAKEATYKSLRRSQQPATISCIHVSNWDKLNAGNTWTFKANEKNRGPISGKGLIIQLPRLLFGFFLTASQL